MERIVKQFQELTLDELYEIIQIRSAVFVVEQNCVYQDLDNVDKDAYHVFLRDEGRIIGYARVVGKGKRLDEVSVGRVISLKRRCGVGSALMRLALLTAKEKFFADKVMVGAQVYAIPFYESVGFRVISQEYLEDGIPHVYMLCEV
jgi:ElaA protein